MINIQELREEATHDGEEIQILRHRIQQVDEKDESEVAEEIGDSEAWTPEARELWQECVCLKNKNNRINFSFSYFLPIPPHPTSFTTNLNLNNIKTLPRTLDKWRWRTNKH